MEAALGAGLWKCVGVLVWAFLELTQENLVPVITQGILLFQTANPLMPCPNLLLLLLQNRPCSGLTPVWGAMLLFPLHGVRNLGSVRWSPWITGPHDQQDAVSRGASTVCALYPVVIVRRTSSKHLCGQAFQLWYCSAPAWACMPLGVSCVLDSLLGASFPNG